MTNYYLDLETTGTNATHDRILTIQFQPLDRATGAPTGALRILKAWESSEKQILAEFIAECRVLDAYPFAFIATGFNLLFEWAFLKTRSVANGLPEIDILAKPFIDLKAIGVLMRHGEFKGTSLDALTGKQGNGSQIAAWYAAGDFDSIVRYVEQEAREFIRFHVWLCERMPVLRREWMRGCKDRDTGEPPTTTSIGFQNATMICAEGHQGARRFPGLRRE